jgi:hypothetical protein
MLLHTKKNKYEKVPSFVRRARSNEQTKKNAAEKDRSLASDASGKAAFITKKAGKVQWVVLRVGQRNVLPIFLSFLKKRRRRLCSTDSPELTAAQPPGLPIREWSSIALA